MLSFWLCLLFENGEPLIFHSSCTRKYIEINVFALASCCCAVIQVTKGPWNQPEVDFRLWWRSWARAYHDSGAMRIFRNGAVIVELDPSDYRNREITLFALSFTIHHWYLLPKPLCPLPECPCQTCATYVIVDALLEIPSTSGCRDYVPPSTVCLLANHCCCATPCLYESCWYGPCVTGSSSWPAASTRMRVTWRATSSADSLLQTYRKS